MKSFFEKSIFLGWHYVLQSNDGYLWIMKKDDIFFSTYSFPQNACSKTEQGLVGSSQVLPPWSGYSVHRTFLLSRNWNFGRWFLSDNSYHTHGWLLLRTSWRQIPAEPFHLCYLLVCIVYLQIWCLSRRQYRRAKQLSTTWINHWTV